MTASLSSRLRLSHVVHRGVLSAIPPRSCASDGRTKTSSRWPLTRKRVSQSQLRHVHAKQPAQPAVVPPPGFAGGMVVATNARGDQAGNVIDPWRENDPRQDRAFAQSGGEMVVLDAAPGGFSSHATDINEAGLVVGGPAAPMARGRDPGRAFIFDPQTGTMTDLGTLPGYDNSAALAINAAGQVVGYAWRLPAEGAPENRAFFYDHRTGLMSDLNDLILPESGWQRLWASDINDAGQIVGRGADRCTRSCSRRPVLVFGPGLNDPTWLAPAVPPAAT